MSGTYLGKDWTGVDYLFELYQVMSPPIVMYFAKMYETLVVSERLDKASKKKKQAEQSAKASGGKQYTHNVSG
jgi:hypothetical protein